ncbi:MAG TPA: FMN-binding protein [bacterium]|nr:FMN-binding protein [bacterium]
MRARGIPLLLALLAAAPLAALERLETADQALRGAYPSAAKFDDSARTLSAGQLQWLKEARHRHALSGQVHWVRAMDAHGHWLGSALLDSELGKHQPIDYLVAMDPSGKVVAVELLVYRETYGGGVRSAHFRTQFVGKDRSAALQLGQDVDAVSGATISSRTFADGVAKALRLFQDFETAAAKAEP